MVKGDPVPGGKGRLSIARGIEVGHIFQLGRVYSEPLGATVLDQDGNSVKLSDLKGKTRLLWPLDLDDGGLVASHGAELGHLRRHGWC